MITPDNSFLSQDSSRYKGLKVYQKSECICDITYYFCQHFLDKTKDRTVDQMIQAARSGKQNIVEGTAASTTSKETEIKLLNVAKASHQELLEDYKDYIIHHGQQPWDQDNPYYQKLRVMCSNHNDRAYYQDLIARHSDITIANIAITLICQVDSMLYGLIERRKKDFLEKGGIKEEMTRSRRAYRQDHPESTDRSTALWEREQKLKAMEQSLAQREQQLAQRERALAQKEQQLAQKEQLLAQREQELGRGL